MSRKIHAYCNLDGGSQFGIVGGGQVIAKRGLEDTSLCFFGLVRAVVGLMCIVSFGVLTTGFDSPPIELVPIAAAGGVLDLLIGTLFSMMAVKRGLAHEAVALANTAPLWGVVAAVIFLGEPAKAASFLAASLVATGAYFVIGKRQQSDAARSHLGVAMALMAGIVWGIAEVVPTKYCLNRGMCPHTYQLIAVASSAVGWGGCNLLRAPQYKPLSWSRRGVQIAGITGFTNLFLGWSLWLGAIGRAPAYLIAPVRGLVVLFAFLFSAAIFKERPSRRAVVGALLIITGVLFVSLVS